MPVRRTLAALRAALLFWQEEIAIHPPDLARPYWEDPSFEPLTATEIENLRGSLAEVKVVRWDGSTGKLGSAELHSAADADQDSASEWALVVPLD